MENKYVSWVRKNALSMISIIVPVVYFCIMLKYYQIEYYCEDFGLYLSSATIGNRSFDGFSSIFLLLAGFATISPKVVTILCLILLALAIYYFLDFFKHILCKNNLQFFILVFLLMGCGVWYYFYGKTFYDWPFTIYSYGLCLLSLKKIILSTRSNEFKLKYWYIFCALVGFMFSWKPYNIFLIAGIGLCMICYDEIRNSIVIPILKKGIYTIFISFLSVLVGYIVGNFNLLIAPKATIEGIMSYPASTNFTQFIFSKERIIWDQICDLPFNISVMNVITLLFLLIVIPICIKKYRYIMLSVFMTGFFYIYITYFSPGYVWHGFTYAGFVLTMSMFIISEIQLKNCATKMLMIGIVAIQCIVNFCFYVPMQENWFNETNVAIKQLEDSESEIAETVSDMMEGLPLDQIGIDCALKRVKPINVSAQIWNIPSIDNTYLSIQNRIYADPLVSNNYSFWSKYGNNYVGLYMDCEYYIYIIPNAFYRIGDVVDINKYSSNTAIETVNVGECTITLYEKP